MFPLPTQAAKVKLTQADLPCGGPAERNERHSYGEGVALEPASHLKWNPQKAIHPLTSFASCPDERQFLDGRRN